MKNSKRIRTMTVDIELPDSYPVTGSFRVFLCAGQDAKWLPIVMIISRGSTNPLEYAIDTYKEVEIFVRQQGLEISNCKIYLDLMECLGIRNNYLYRWDVGKGPGGFYSQVKPINLKELFDEEIHVFRSYYEDRWSLFTESMLTNEEKAEIVASALADSIYDENSAEGVQIAIRYKLLDIIRSGINLLSMFLGRFFSGYKA
ncbi:MAG: hypothetical protein M1609_03590 [Firmicutes bacterium]|nr:hypothetical protein [Bacillota bacterium]MCL5779580.1 hypothetical protein [Bacillota bacterium]